MSSISGINTSLNYGNIASGKRIQGAADDAAGLTIAKKLETQNKGLQAGEENMGAAKAALTIEDGALGGINEYLQKIKELSVKAMNGTNSDSDLQAIQKDIDGALAGIKDLAKGTEFNTKKLLDGSMGTMETAGNPDGTGMKIQMADATLESLGIEGYNVTGKFDIGAIDNAINKVNEARTTAGASMNALEYGMNYNSNAALQQTSAQSGIEDLDIGKAVSEQKKNEVLDEYRIMMQKKQMEEESIVTKML